MKKPEKVYYGELMEEKFIFYPGGFEEQYKADLKRWITEVEICNIVEEFKKAEKKHPNWPVHNIFEQQCIVSEEAGEICKAVWDYKHDGLLLDDVKHELRQTAAMCLRMLINLEE